MRDLIHSRKLKTLTSCLGLVGAVGLAISFVTMWLAHAALWSGVGWVYPAWVVLSWLSVLTLLGWATCALCGALSSTWLQLRAGR